MKTMFINLDARRVTISGCEMDQKACVGQETVCYTVLPRRKEQARTGKVLDFEACRRALEEEMEEKAPRMERPAPEQEEEPRRRLDLVLAADIAASVGVLLLVAAVAVRFFLG